MLSFSTKPLLHSRTPRKISLGHIWLHHTPCFLPKGSRLESSAIFFKHYTTVFLIPAISAWFFIPVQADQKQDLCTFLPLSSFPERIWEAQPSARILACSHIVGCTALWCLYVLVTPSLTLVQQISLHQPLYMQLVHLRVWEKKQNEAPLPSVSLFKSLTRILDYKLWPAKAQCQIHTRACKGTFLWMFKCLMASTNTRLTGKSSPWSHAPQICVSVPNRGMSKPIQSIHKYLWYIYIYLELPDLENF